MVAVRSLPWDYLAPSKTDRALSGPTAIGPRFDSCSARHQHSSAASYLSVPDPFAGAVWAMLRAHAVEQAEFCEADSNREARAEMIRCPESHGSFARHALVTLR